MCVKEKMITTVVALKTKYLMYVKKNLQRTTCPNMYTMCMFGVDLLAGCRRWCSWPGCGAEPGSCESSLKKKKNRIFIISKFTEKNFTLLTAFLPPFLTTTHTSGSKPHRFSSIPCTPPPHPLPQRQKNLPISQPNSTQRLQQRPPAIFSISINYKHKWKRQHPLSNRPSDASLSQLWDTE